MSQTTELMRPIRSFVLRQGRMTPAQKQALQQDGATYGLEVSASGYLDWQKVFGRDAPRILEIGFGMGDHLITLAKTFPQTDFLGIEVHPPGVGKCLASARDAGITNIKLFSTDAIPVLTQAIAPHSIDKVFLLFPDPWPKKRHQKRRIVQPAFVDLIATCLKPNGLFHLATDWQDYAEYMLSVLETHPAFTNAFGKDTYAPLGFERFETKFERRGVALGHRIYDLVYTLTK